MKKGFRGSSHLPRCLPPLFCVRPRVGAFLLVIDGDDDAYDGEDHGSGDEDVDDDHDDADDGEDDDDDDDFSCPSEHHHSITAFKC